MLEYINYLHLGRGDQGRRPQVRAGGAQSYISKGIGRQGIIRLFCQELLCFNTMPCRRMPLLVHFGGASGGPRGGHGGRGAGL